MPNITTAKITRFDPLDRTWYMHAESTEVSVSIAPTLRQLLKTLMKAAGQQEGDCRFRVVRAADGIRIFLFARGVHAEIGLLQHAGGAQITDDLDADSPLDTRSLDAIVRAFPPAWRKGWTTHRYVPSPESRRRLRVGELCIRAIDDPALGAALFAAEKTVR